jgi:hypothetical protein
MDEATTVRQTIREWWQGQIEGQDDVDVKELASKAVVELQADPDFRSRFFEETLQSVVYNVGIAVVSSLRPRETTQPRKVSARAVADAIAIRQEIRGVDWSKWLVHDPLSSKHVRFLSMTKEQVLAASKERFDVAATDLRIAGLFQLVAGRMDDGQTVGDAWNEHQLDDIVSRVQVGRPRVSLSAVAGEG